MDDLAFLIGDNTNVYSAIVREIYCPFIGCYSHRLNLVMAVIIDNSRFKINDLEVINSN